MEINYYKWYSYELNRDMEYKIYGTKGKPFIYFPTQFNRFYEAEDKGVVETLSYLIESGKIILIACDSIDSESLSNYGYWDKNRRLELEESYYNYFIKELYVALKHKLQFKELPVLFGMSFGAYQAMNFFLRRPDLFSGVFAMSGIYRISYFIKDYYNKLAFYNSPIDSVIMLNNLDYLKLYNQKKILMVVSNGAYENEAYQNTIDLERELKSKGIKNETYYWSNNYPHDFNSWNIYLNYYIKDFLS